MERREEIARWFYDREPACGWRTVAGKIGNYAVLWDAATNQQREDAWRDADAILALDRPASSQGEVALREALRIFVGAAYPVAPEINPRGHNWSEAYLDQALEIARAALPLTASREVERDVLDAAFNIVEQYGAFIRTVKADDLELHPYLPLVEQTGNDLREAISTLSQTEAILHAAQFLSDRLDDLEWMDDQLDQTCRDYMGHVDPAHHRLKGLLSLTASREGEGS